MHSCLLVLDYMLIYYTFLSSMQRKRQIRPCEKGHKKHPEKASHLYPMQAELGIGDGRPWAPKCGRACAIVGTRPRRGQGSGKAMLPDIHFFLLVSLKWASAAGCTLPLTHPMTHGAYGRSAPSGAALPVIS